MLPQAAVPPSDTLRFGIIGIGMQGSGLLRTSNHTSPASSAWRPAICTTAGTICAQEIVGKPIPATRRYQDLLDNKEIDCIINATPDHWHKQIVVDCCNAGKDVYSEKPMTHERQRGLRNDRRGAEEQSHCADRQPARQLHCLSPKPRSCIAQGAIGEVHTVEGVMGRNSPDGAWQYPPPPDLSPQNLDWDTWLGTTPKIPFNPVRFARWRCWQAYGSGVAGDLMVHLLTGIHYVGGITQPPERAQCHRRDFPVQGWARRSRRSPRALRLPAVPGDHQAHPDLRSSLSSTRFYGTGGLLEISGEAIDPAPPRTEPITARAGTTTASPRPCGKNTRRSGTWKTIARLAKSGTETVTFRPPAGYDDDSGAPAEFLRLRAQPQAGD